MKITIELTETEVNDLDYSIGLLKIYKRDFDPGNPDWLMYGYLLDWEDCDDILLYLNKILEASKESEK